MDEIPYGVHRHLNRPKGVIKVVSNWLSSSSVTWWYLFIASSTVKYLASLAAMSATAWEGVIDW